MFLTTQQTDEQTSALRFIERGLRGDQAAYTALYGLFAAGVYRLCYGLVLNEQDAEDVSQEVFVYAFKNLHRYDANKAAFKTWLYTIAVSRCRNTYRRKRLPQVDIAQLFNNEIAAPSTEQPEAVAAYHAAQSALVAALSDLPVNLREAVILRYGHSLTYREIAAVMDCPPKTAESRVRLAHERLRHVLAPQGQGLLDELVSF
ncbi:MAG: sigma-70 family RNA polymerase sigma factor [Anaerolineaceae bacterium]|nr:MAG: sigma-70 family RNA polymerase sigma factor [Anaerolineaceae bacterium]